MDMQDACAAMLEEVEGALGCIVIDMQTGLAVAAEYRAGSVVDAAAINLVSVISTDMFRGKMIHQFESVLARRGGGLTGFVREVQMTTAATNQFMAAIPGWDDGVFVLVTDKSVSLGLGWMTVHRVVARLGAAEPAWTPPAQQQHRNPALERETFAGREPMPSHVAPARPVAPATRQPAEHAGYQSAPAEYAASPQPYGGVAERYNAVPGPAGVAPANRIAHQAPMNMPPAAPMQQPHAAAAQQHAMPEPPVDQQPDEPEPVPLGPRMNIMSRRPRRAKK